MSGLLGEQNRLAGHSYSGIVIKVSWFDKFDQGMGHIYFSSNLQRPVWQFGQLILQAGTI